MVGEVREYDELAGIYEKLDTVRITTSTTVVRWYFSTYTVGDIIDDLLSIVSNVEGKV